MSWTKMKGWMVLGFILLACQSNAQLIYSDGYIVKFNKDTIYGKIGFTTPAERSVKIMFRENGIDEKIKYRPFQIKGYFVLGDWYESKIYDIHPSLSYGLGVFMVLKVGGFGQVKLYEYWNTDKERGFTQIFLYRPGYPLEELKRFKFKKQASAYFSDYEEMSKDILEGKYKRRQIEELVIMYNEWAYPQTD